MTATLDGVATRKQDEQSGEARAVAELVRLAQEQGLSLGRPDGLLKQFTTTVLETAPAEKMTQHLGDAGGKLNPVPAETNKGQHAAVQRAQIGLGAQRARAFRFSGPTAHRHYVPS